MKMLSVYTTGAHQTRYEGGRFSKVAKSQFNEMTC
jgi:hypothetical protein